MRARREATARPAALATAVAAAMLGGCYATTGDVQELDRRTRQLRAELTETQQYVIELQQQVRMLSQGRSDGVKGPRAMPLPDAPGKARPPVEQELAAAGSRAAGASTQGALDGRVPGGSAGDGEGDPAAAELFHRGKAAMDADRGGDGRALFQQVIRDHPDDPYAARARLELGRAYAMSGRPFDAIEAFLTIIEEHPPGPWTRKAYLDLGKLLLVVRQQEAGLRLLHDLAEAYPDSSEGVEAQAVLDPYLRRGLEFTDGGAGGGESGSSGDAEALRAAERRAEEEAKARAAAEARAAREAEARAQAEARAAAAESAQAEAEAKAAREARARAAAEQKAAQAAQARAEAEAKAAAAAQAKAEAEALAAAASEAKSDAEGRAQAAREAKAAAERARREAEQLKQAAAERAAAAAESEQAAQARAAEQAKRKAAAEARARQQAQARAEAEAAAEEAAAAAARARQQAEAEAATRPASVAKMPDMPAPPGGFAAEDAQALSEDHLRRLREAEKKLQFIPFN